MSKLILALAVLFSINSFASVKPVAPCNDKQLARLEMSIQDWKKDEGYSNIYYIKNLKGQILGYYSTETDDRDGIHAEICDYVYQDDLTVSNDWYYWDQYGKSTHPTKWNKNDTLRISQDEGFAYFKVLTANKNGNIKADFKVVGWADSDDEIVVRASLIVLEKKN